MDLSTNLCGFLLPLRLTKPLVLPGVNKKALANKLVETSSKET